MFTHCTPYMTQTDCPPGQLPPPPWAHDKDENDVREDATTAPPGIIVRTDYSAGSDDAWIAFCSTLHDAEREFFADQAPTPGDGSSSSSDEEDDSESSSLFAPLSDPARFDGISNLRALRLLFDVSVRVAPGSEQQQQQSLAGGGRGVQHRLSGLRGLQETYDARGRTLWIFDARSRTDGCGDVATWVSRLFPLFLPFSFGADV